MYRSVAPRCATPPLSPVNLKGEIRGVQKGDNSDAKPGRVLFGFGNYVLMRGT